MVYWITRLYLPSMTKLTGGKSFLLLLARSILFPHIPRSICFFLSNFLATYINAALPPTNIYEVLGTLTLLSSHCKGSSFYLASIHSFPCLPEGLIFPQSGLNLWRFSFSASPCDRSTHRALPKQLEYCAFIFIFCGFVISGWWPSTLLHFETTCSK